MYKSLLHFVDGIMRFSLERQKYFALHYCTLTDWSVYLASLSRPIRSESPKPVAVHSHLFSRAPYWSRAFGSSFDWSTEYSSSFVISQSDYFVFLFYDTQKYSVELIGDSRSFMALPAFERVKNRPCVSDLFIAALKLFRASPTVKRQMCGPRDVFFIKWPLFSRHFIRPTC